jgi:hypothetical protein
MNAADRLGLPTIEELIAAAKVGHLDDRVERYLPDSLYAAPATAEPKAAKPAKAADRAAAKAVNGQQNHRVDTAHPVAHPVAAKAAHVTAGRPGTK